MEVTIFAGAEIATVECVNVLEASVNTVNTPENMMMIHNLVKELDGELNREGVAPH